VIIFNRADISRGRHFNVTLATNMLLAVNAMQCCPGGRPSAMMETCRHGSTRLRSVCLQSIDRSHVVSSLPHG